MRGCNLYLYGYEIHLTGIISILEIRCKNFIQAVALVVWSSVHCFDTNRLKARQFMYFIDHLLNICKDATALTFFFIWPIFNQDWPLQQGWYQLQGGKTFCASFCASFIAGSRRAFLWLRSTVCLFVTERVLTKTEWNAQGVNVCSSKNLFTFVWFFVTWKLLWTRNNQC